MKRGDGGRCGRRQRRFAVQRGRDFLERERLSQGAGTVRRGSRGKPESRGIAFHARTGVPRISASFPEAAKEFEAYTKIAPNGPNAKDSGDQNRNAEGVHQVRPAPAVDATIASNLQSVRSRIDAAARRAGRDPSDIRLIAVSKTFGADHVARRMGRRAARFRREQGAGSPAEDRRNGRHGDKVASHRPSAVEQGAARRRALSPAFTRSTRSISCESWTPAADGTGRGPLELLVQVDLAGEETKFGAAADEARRIVDAAHDGSRPCGLPA